MCSLSARSSSFSTRHSSQTSFRIRTDHACDDAIDFLSNRIIPNHNRCAANPSQTPPPRTATADRQPRNLNPFLLRIRTLSEAATVTSVASKLLAQRKPMCHPQQHDAHRNALPTLCAEERYATLHINPVANPDLQEVCSFECAFCSSPSSSSFSFIEQETKDRHAIDASECRQRIAVCVEFPGMMHRFLCVRAV